MPFKPDELVVGMTAHFKINQMRSRADVRCWRECKDRKPRPFLCFADDGDDTYWLALTTAVQPQRLRIEREWIRYAKGRFQGPAPYACDLRDVHVGPAEAFSEMSRKYDKASGFYNRVYLTPEGAKAVHLRVAFAGAACPRADIEMADLLQTAGGAGVRRRETVLKAA